MMGLRNFRSRRVPRYRLAIDRLEDRLNPVLGDFELDGNATTQATHDWDQVYNDVVLNPGQDTSRSITGALGFFRDPANSAFDNIFVGGQSTDINDLSQWRIGQGTPQAKADLADVFAAAYEVPVGGQTHTVVNFGADRISNNGNATVGFWFFQNRITVNPNGTINGVHAVGDLLIVADYASTVASFAAYRWVGPSGSTSALQPLTINSNDGFAIANAANTPTGGWPFQDRIGSPPNTLAPGEFFEAGIDLTALGLSGKISTIVAETRASTSLNAVLSDFLIAQVTTFTADVTVAKTVDNPTPNVGDTVTFTVTVTNNGPNNATGVTVADSLPAGLDFVSDSPSQGNYDDTTGVWTVGDLDRGQTETLQLVATVIGAAPVTNIAIADADQDDLDLSDNTATADVTPQQADLRLVKTVNNPTPNVGDTVTFTLTLTNQGPNTATNVVVTDQLPAGLTFVSATTTRGTYDSGTGVWTVGTLGSGAIARLFITATVDSLVPVTNAGTADADQYDPEPANNTDDAVVSPRWADLQIQKTVDNPTPNVGDVVTYTVTVTNLGKDLATNITVLDTLPAGVRFLSGMLSRGVFNVRTNVWTIGSLAAGASATFTIRVLVTSPAPTANIAAITGADQFDPNTANNIAISGVSPLSADLNLVKDVSNPTPIVGETITYTLTLTNQGPNLAANSVVSDPLPAGLAFVGATASQGAYDPATGTWTVGPLASGAAATLLIDARVTLPIPVTNVAVASSATFDPDPADNRDDAVLIPRRADLAVTKTVDNRTPNVGDTITFTVQVTNRGPNDTTGVVIQDILPSDVAIVTSTASQGTFNTTDGTWNVGDLINGATAQLVIEVIVTGPSAGTNVATVIASDTPDPFPGNNTGTADIVPLQADLNLVKTVNNRLPNVGDTVTFTLTLTNQGPNAATNTTVNDVLPTGLTFVSAIATRGTYVPATGVWTVGTLASGGVARLNIVARVDSLVPLTNTGTADADQYDPDPADNSDDATVSPRWADLAVTKVVDNPTPNVGDTVTYTITVTNLGKDVATNITIRDTLPSGVRLLSAVPNRGTINVRSSVWTIPTLAVGATATLTIRVLVTSPNPTANLAAITGANQFDPNTGNNVAVSGVNPLSADLSLVKDVSDPTPNVGDIITFTLTLTNTGADPATGVVVSDPLPAGLAFVNATASQGTYNPATGLWTVGDLGVSLPVTLAIDARVTSPAPTTNIAVASAATFDPDPSDNTGRADITPQQADLIVAKTVNDPSPNVGDVVAFTVTLTNEGPNDATGVTVTDVLSAGMALVTATPSQGTFDEVSGTWDVGTVAFGASATLLIRARLTVNQSQVNTARVTGADQFDPDTGNNRASVIVDPAQADLAVTKVASSTRVIVGNQVTFTITVRNLGPNTAANVFVADLLPAGLTFVSAQPSQGTYTPRTGRWVVNTLVANGSATLRITARVMVAGTFRNTAVVGFTGTDPDLSNNVAAAGLVGIGLPNDRSKRQLLGSTIR